MAVNTVLNDSGAQRPSHFTEIIVFPVVTGHASLGKKSQLSALIFMRIMTGDTGHGSADPETSGGTKQPILIAMHVNFIRIGAVRIGLEIIGEPVACSKLKRRF